jgi:hypothetical protein
MLFITTDLVAAILVIFARGWRSDTEFHALDVAMAKSAIKVGHIGFVLWELDATMFVLFRVVLRCIAERPGHIVGTAQIVWREIAADLADQLLGQFIHGSGEGCRGGSCGIFLR